MLRPFFGICVIMLFNLSATWSSAAPPKRITEVEGIREYRLDNGLRLLLFPDPSGPTVTVAMTVFVGSRHEGAGEGGMAHLLEHMVFKGTPAHPAIPKALQDRGARFNGTTSFDRTNYFETLTASDENLEFALRLEADRLINSTIKGEDLASEMTVVRNEFERSENSPSRVLTQRMMAAAYEWHSYGRPTIGNRSDIERVPLPNLRAFYRKYYQPDNAMVVVAGQFDEAKALEYAQKYFGAIPRPDRVLPTTYTEEPAQDGERTVVLRRVGDLPLVGVGYHIPAASHPEFSAVAILSEILGSPGSGRLYKELVQTKMAATVQGAAYQTHDPGLIGFTAAVTDDSLVEDVRRRLLEVIEDTGRQGVTDEEVQRARQKILKRRELGLSDSSRVAVSLSNWASQGDWRLFFLHRDRVENVTAGEVQEVAARYLQRNNRTVGLFLPSEKAERVEVPASTDLAESLEGYEGRGKVVEGETFSATPDNIEKRTERRELAGGLRVALLPKKTRGEAVHLQLVLRYGDDYNLKGFEAACGMLPELMIRGTQRLDRVALQDKLDEHFATLNASGSTGRAAFQVQTKRQELPAVLALLREVLQEPRLDQAEYEVLKRQQLAGLERVKNDPQFLASNRLSQLLEPYPRDDVRNTPTVNRSITMFKQLQLDTISNLHREFLGAVGELAIVGDFDSEATLPLLEQLVAGLEASETYERIAYRTFPDVPGQRVTIETPDKANAVYYAGLMIAMQDRHPDYPALMLANNILGASGLSSRLGDRVRQKEGLSYGVRSSLSASPLDPRAQFSAFAISNPENSPRVVTAIREELERLLADGVTEDELAEAKQSYLQRQQVSRTSDRTLVSILTNTLYAERTMQFYEELERGVEQVTRQQLLEAARKYLSPQQLVVITAGDFKQTPATPTTTP